MKHRKAQTDKLDRTARAANISIIVGLLLMAIPAGFWLNAEYYQWSQSKQWEPLVERFSGSDKSVVLEEPSGSGNNRDSSSTGNAETFKWSPDLVDTSTTQMGNTIAFLEIRKLGFRLSVLEGADWANLAKGPAHVSSTVRIGDKGTALVSGHRTMYGAPFHDLHKLEPGDIITIYTKKAQFVYTVEGIKKVHPKDWSDIKPMGEPYLVLSTCEPIFSAEKRLLIISKLTRANKLTPGLTSPLPAN